MRALFVTSPGLSHIFPTIPLAHALRAAGHDVRYATGGHVHTVAEAGLYAVDVSPGVDYAKVFVPDDSDVKDPMHSDDLGIGFFAQMFARVSSVAVDGTVEVARAWQPDVVLCTPTQGAGPLVASMHGLPCIELPLGPADADSSLGPLLRRAMAADYARHDVTGMPARTVRITPMPPSIEKLVHEEIDSGSWTMRYVPYNGGAVLPSWLLHRPEKPRIAVTLGSIDGLGEGMATLAPFVSAAGSVDAEFVLTLGGGDVKLLGELPPNLRVVDWVPLGALLETCAAIVHHGGSGTLLTALAAGIPQCAIPHGAYQEVNRKVLTGTGIGFATEAAALGADECRRLIEDQSLRDAATDMRNELATMPPPSAVVGRLEELVG